MWRTRRRWVFMLGAAAAAALGLSAEIQAEYFAATLSGPQIELKFRRLRDAHELKVDGALPWVFEFSGRDSTKLEALSLRLVRDGFRIVSLQTVDAVTTLRVTRTELLTPAGLEHRGRELAKLAAAAGPVSYAGADVTAP